MVASLTTQKDDKDGPTALRVLPNSPATERGQPDECLADGATDIPRSKGSGSKSKSKAKTKAKIDTSAKASEPNDAPAFNLAKGSRGVDTLLRNAYRAQLDMLALAATKANIMISLNGLLMSMLIISGTHLISINGMYMLPISIFLITCALATTFAVFAARPEISRKKFNYADFMHDEARLMVFEEFSDLHDSEYIDAMSHLLNDPQRTYKAMLAHIYDLGVTADKKYQHLYYSYTAFMVGTIFTVTSLLLLVALKFSGVLMLT